MVIDNGPALSWVTRSGNLHACARPDGKSAWHWPGFFCAEPWPHTAASLVRFSVAASFPFCPTNGGIFLPVTVSGREYLFLLDTGTSLMIYGQKFQKLLGPAIKRELVKGTALEGRTNAMSNAPAAFLGKISLQTPEPVLIQDLSDFRLLSRLPVDGVIGMSALGRHFVHLAEFYGPERPGH